jgi:hypothetical protein
MEEKRLIQFFPLSEFSFRVLFVFIKITNVIFAFEVVVVGRKMHIPIDFGTIDLGTDFHKNRLNKNRIVNLLTGT